MREFLLIFHLVVTVLMVVLILLQKSEGGLFNSSSSAGIFTPRGTADLLSRATGVLVFLFFAASLALVILSGKHGAPTSVLDQLQSTQQKSSSVKKASPPLNTSPQAQAPAAQKTSP